MGINTKLFIVSLFFAPVLCSADHARFHLLGVSNQFSCRAEINDESAKFIFSNIDVFSIDQLSWNRQEIDFPARFSGFSEYAFMVYLQENKYLIARESKNLFFGKKYLSDSGPLRKGSLEKLLESSELILDETDNQGLWPTSQEFDLSLTYEYIPNQPIFKLSGKVIDDWNTLPPTM